MMRSQDEEIPGRNQDIRRSQKMIRSQKLRNS